MNTEEARQREEKDSLTGRSYDLDGNLSEKKSLPALAKAGQEIDQRRKSRGKSLTQTARISRELTRQSSRPLVQQQQELFNHLSPKQREHAVFLSSENGLLSSLIDGIDGGELLYKVIIALAITLYEQSELYGTTTDLTGASELLLPLFAEEGDERQKPRLIVRGNGGKVTAEGKYVTSSCPIVFINVSEFTKLVFGTDEKPDSKSKSAVKEVLYTLKIKNAYMCASDGAWAFRTLIGKTRGGIDTKTGAELIAIELDSIFTRMIKNDFAIIRKDTLRKLRGNQKKITMRLLHFLLEQFSYHKPICAISKEQLFQRIAIIEAYSKNPKRRDEDFDTAIKKMVDCKLILPATCSKDLFGKTIYNKDGGYYEEIGADGYSLYSYFRLNPGYTKGDIIEAEEAINPTEVNSESTKDSVPMESATE